MMKNKSSENLILSVLIIILLISTFSCSGNKQKEIAERAVERFHSQLNKEEYNDIYAQAGEEFRNAKNEEEWEIILRGIHQKLGNVQQSNLASFRIVFSNTGISVNLVYNTEFSGGKASELFTWRVKENQASLIGYYIKTPIPIMQ